jgi:valyl-tRNA synthetase
MNLEEEPVDPPEEMTITLPERWIMTRLGEVGEKMAGALDDYLFNEAASTGYQFVWHEYCDWYLEMAKPALYGKDPLRKSSARVVLQESFKAVLKLIHPFMPFVTEEIWQRLPGTEGSIMKAPYPGASDFPADSGSVKEMEVIMGIITGVRNIRGEMNIPPSKKVSIVIDNPNKREEEFINQSLIHIQNLAGVEEVTVGSRLPKPEASASAISGESQVHVLLKGLIDFDEEKKRLRKQIKSIEEELEAAKKKLSNKQFMDKAPAEIVNKVRGQVDSMDIKLKKLIQNLNFFESVDA